MNLIYLLGRKSKMTNKKLRMIVGILFLGLIFFNHIVYAEADIAFKNLTIDDGLSQSTVQIIFQDSKGYIWMGTNDGLNRYNGYEMKIFKSTDEKNSISDNYILNITEDNDGYLWVSTCYGITRINVNDGETKSYYVGKDKGNLPSNFINCILVMEDNTILAGTSNGVAMYNRETDSFENTFDNESFLKNKDIKAITEDIYGDLWIGTKDGLSKKELKSGEMKYFFSQGDDKTEIYSLLSDSKGFLWVGTLNDGLRRINIKTEDTEEYFSNESDNNKAIPSNTIKKMMEDSEGNIWIGTKEGLVKYDRHSDKFITHRNKYYDSHSLINDYVFSVIEDNSGLIWVGTYAGVSIFDLNRKIVHYRMDPFNSNSLSSNVIHGIYEDDEGLLWIGTSNSGLNVMDRKTNNVYHMNEHGITDKIPSDSIKVITGHKEYIWIGTSKGLAEINKNTREIKVYDVNTGLKGENIKSLLYDSKGYLWVGSSEGLDIIEVATGKIIGLTDTLVKSGILDTYIDEIYEDNEGIYWIGSFLGGGLTQIDPYNNAITNYKDKNSNENNTRAINTIRTIVDGYSNDLWIGTSGGLRRFDKVTGEFNTYGMKDGLPSDTIYGILKDDYGNLWMSTNNGICKLDSKAEEFRNLTILDGLQGNEFNGKACFKNKDDEMFFGGINGLNVFKSEDILKSKYNPKVVFDGFEIQGKDYKDINNLSISYGKDIIRIKYFVPNYINVKKIQYQYKLEGLSTEWITVTNNEVIFNNLKPGSYKFKIRARNQEGMFSEESNVSFRIEPPIWRSKYAISIYVIVILILIYLDRTKMRRLDNLVNKRTKQLVEEIDINTQLFNQILKLERNKNNYFINLSHELRTPLNVINSVEQLISHLNKSEEGIEKDKLEHYMKVTRRNTKRLLNLINNIIDVSKFEHGSYKINLKEENIIYVVEEAALSLKDYIESRGIELIVDTDVEEKIIACDALEIERCIVNLVSNAAKFTSKQGTIKVLMHDLGDKIRIDVIDNGTGIAEEYHRSIFDRFNQVIGANSEEKGGSGLGLTITKHIVTMHNGEIYVESELNKGSKFTIILPS